MDLFDDYQDEVERLTHDQIEAILSGDDHSSRPLTTLIRDVRLGLLENPSPEIAGQHLAAMARAHPPVPGWTVAPEAKTRRRRVLPRRRLTTVVVAAALLLIAGLAAAVTLPKMTAQPAQDTVPSTAPSVTPPAQDLPEEAAHGQAVADVATDPSLSGCEKGQAVSDVASAKGAENGKGPAEKNDPCARTRTPGKPKSGRGGHAHTGPRGSKGGRDDSQSAKGVGSTTGPGLGDERPVGGGSEAGGGGGASGPSRGRGEGSSKVAGRMRSNRDT
jgi:hypothetical protein